MSEIVIKVENLFKEYHLGKIGYGTLKEDIQSWWAKIHGKEDPNSLVTSYSRDSKGLDGHFLALNDISFDVKKGEAIGIIGRNGAGKSTLLKILSRTTSPSSGIVKIKGKISSLLEVGTGFHPDLTGRENVFLNGTILGMTKKEILKKFDEIVSFSGIEQFIDTPVKRYSSGMYVRLAFAVAAHFISDILVLDEVLAVGDTDFQKKCLDKMSFEIKNNGRTILFVSHDMRSIKNLCPKTLLMEKGKIKYFGDTYSIISAYIQDTNELDKINRNPEISFNVDTNKGFQLIYARLFNDNLNNTVVFDCDENINLELICEISTPHIPGIFGAIQIYKPDQTFVFFSDSNDIDNEILEKLETGRYSIKIKIPKRILAAGKYHLNINFNASNGEIIDVHPILFLFEVNDYKTARGNNRPGYISTLLKWDNILKIR
jgi:lipopolysaccharide transport system ATP-binding protein